MFISGCNWNGILCKFPVVFACWNGEAQVEDQLITAKGLTGFAFIYFQVAVPGIVKLL